MYILVATTVLGQRDLYHPAEGPPVAQERKIYDYTDYVMPTNIVETRTRRNSYVPPKSEEEYLHQRQQRSAQYRGYGGYYSDIFISGKNVVISDYF